MMAKYHSKINPVITDRIKSSLSMLDVANRYGITVERGGKALCPFHGDRHPSLKIYAEPGRGFCCFACGAKGSVIDFVMMLFRIGFREALVRIDHDFGLGLIEGQPPDPEALKRLAEAQAERKRKEQAYWQMVDDFFRLDRAYEEKRPTTLCEEWHPEFAEACMRLEQLRDEMQQNGWAV